MTNKERVKAILNYEPYDRIPVIHFGYWTETLEKWYQEGHITKEEWLGYSDANEYDQSIASKLGFDFNWQPRFGINAGLYPKFEETIIETLPDGGRKVLDSNGAIILEKPGLVSIPMEFDHLLKDRESFLEHYLPKLQFSKERMNLDQLHELSVSDYYQENPFGLHCGSLFGEIRNWLGVEGASYLYVDDEDTFKDLIDTVGQLTLEVLENLLQTECSFDYAHFWEDICYKNGPLINPSVFEEFVGPWYKKITTLLNAHGISTVSVDCDGLIDYLIPTWLNNGVNTMFPIEVGTWNASIAPWREQYGKIIRGIGGMNKNIFSLDYHAVDLEVERLKKLIDLGGYIPCPDHRIPPDAKWENVQYYCDKMHHLK